MKERPIIFSGDLVLALLGDRKTQTRRIITPQPVGGVHLSTRVPGGFEDGHGRGLRCRYGAPGDRLWVKETWQTPWMGATQMFPACAESAAMYAAAPRVVYRASWDGPPPICWRPSIHMFRWASRLSLDLTSVRAERLENISEEDARAEGVAPVEPDVRIRRPDWGHRLGFFLKWSALHGMAGLQANPWVWVLGVRRVTG